MSSTKQVSLVLVSVVCVVLYFINGMFNFPQSVPVSSLVYNLPVDSVHFISKDKSKHTASVNIKKQNPVAKQIKQTNYIRNDGSNKTFKIVLYHFYHGLLKWNAESIEFNTCVHYKNCEVSLYQGFTTGVIDADALLLQGNNIARPTPRRRDVNQMLVFLTVESPQYLHFTSLAEQGFVDYFNWTMTYRLDSDIPYPYGVIVPANVNLRAFQSKAEIVGISKTARILWKSKKRTQVHNTTEDYNASFEAKNKSKSAIWLVSHCNTASQREKYVYRMQKHMDIDIVGKCTKTEAHCPKSTSCIENIVKTYKFYLAFENSLCTDYITEKAFNWFNLDIVIVVRGAKRYSQYFPPGTFIDSDEFDSPEQLAKYLTTLAANKKEYSAILERKAKYNAIQGQQLYQIAYCNLCYRLNNRDKFRHTVPHLHAWWDQGVCSSPDPKLKKGPSATTP